MSGDQTALFDTGEYWRHPGLWPPADDTVMTDDQAAELLWPGITQTTTDWNDMAAGEGPAVWGTEALG